jgi:hypothetical protein
MVSDAMITCAVVHEPTATAAQLRAFFGDERVHCALIVDRGRLIGVLDRGDLWSAGDARPRYIGRLEGRIVRPDADLERTRLSMLEARRRRLAVVTSDGMLSGLLCLRATGAGFCSDSDVQARAGSCDNVRIAADPARAVHLTNRSALRRQPSTVRPYRRIACGREPLLRSLASVNLVGRCNAL